MPRKRHPPAGPRAAPGRTEIDPITELYRSVRSVTQGLAAPLSPEDCMVQSMADASPVKWHLAHTTWFFETFVLERYASGYRPFHPAFRVLFNSYYNAVGDRPPRPERGLLTRPDLAEILEYRAYVDDRMLALLGNADGISPECLGLVTLGVNHEEQHQELILTDVKHLLSKNPLEPAYRERWPLVPVRPGRSRWVPFAGGEFEIGHAGPTFAFDNETPRHRLLLQPFELASHPVTYGEFASFVEDAGYRRPELWLSLGWEAVQAQGWQAPLYWAKRDGQWTTFTLHGRVVIEPHTPVCHLSYFEADAYARWAGARLPGEAEWEIAAGGTIAAHANFLESGALHPLAPQRDPATSGLAQIYGDVWEWTRSGYEPYPGYRPAPGTVGEYNGKFMCSQYVLRGGSCATPRRHIRPTYRNFFPPEARWQFSGLRLARDV